MSDYLPIGQKFKINDQVYKKQNVGLSVKRSSIIGTIIDVQEKLNTIGRTCYYYKVLWDDTRTSIHAQHILIEANQPSLKA
tara:strand:+ start:130 stop:372 length:243 start_codon:yes stop_codon:yes gene_type:complete